MPNACRDIVWSCLVHVPAVIPGRVPILTWPSLAIRRFPGKIFMPWPTSWTNCPCFPALIGLILRGVATRSEIELQLDPDLAPLPVAQSSQQPRSDLALVLCRGFGGMNAALLVRAPAARSDR